MLICRMTPVHHNDQHRRRAEQVDAALAHCIERAKSDGIAVREVLTSLGPASFCFACFVLSVPFIQPFSLGPLTMASGAAFMAAGWQMAHGHAIPILPETLMQHRLHGTGWVYTLQLCHRILGWCRAISRPRMQSWLTGQRGDQFVGWLICIGGFLLAVPMANIPFNNVPPALMVLCATIAWLEMDGLFALLSMVWGLVALAFFAVVGWLVWTSGGWLVEHIQQWLQ